MQCVLTSETTQCEDYALTAPTGDCAAGYYCSSGAFDREGHFCFDLDIYEADFDPATDSNITSVNATRISYLVDCGDDGGPCTVGHFCLSGGIGDCTHYPWILLLIGAGYPEPCPLGT